MKTNMNNTVITEKSISEVLFDVLEPKKITSEQSRIIYNLKLAVERAIEQKNDGRNWAIRDIPLDLLEVDLAYQREPKNHEIAKITNKFDINKVEVKAASIRKVNGEWHIFLMDGAHTLSALLYVRSHNINTTNFMTCKVFVGLTQKQEAELFAAQNEGKTNIRGMDRYKAELCAEVPNAVIIDKITKKFGLTVKTNFSTTINRYRNINAIEALYRIVKRNGETGLNFVFSAISLLGWENEEMAYNQKTLMGFDACYSKCKDSSCLSATLAGLVANIKSVHDTCADFIEGSTSIKEKASHPAEQVRTYAIQFCPEIKK